MAHVPARSPLLVKYFSHLGADPLHSCRSGRGAQRQMDAQPPGISGSIVRRFDARLGPPSEPDEQSWGFGPIFGETIVATSQIVGRKLGPDPFLALEKWHCFAVIGVIRGPKKL